MNVTTVRENLPKGDFSVMTEMLKKFLNFMNLTVSTQVIDQYNILNGRCRVAEIFMISVVDTILAKCLNL